ncbi:PAS domain S-box protein [Piscinibacter sakaiensis]|uniref:PAS domain-containing protein n=1 Tax=Piscinibacter sakaiensis TaxID=1547922 RepID=UPI003726D711
MPPDVEAVARRTPLQRRRRLARGMLAAAALAGLLLIGLVAQVLSASREAYDRRARATVTAVVTIAQRVVGEQLARVDASLQATEAELALLRRTWPGDEGARACWWPAWRPRTSSGCSPASTWTRRRRSACAPGTCTWWLATRTVPMPSPRWHRPATSLRRRPAYRRVEGWPLLMMAGVGNERFFAPWRDQAWQTVGLAVGAWLLFVAALAAAYRAWVREAQRSRELADQTRHTQALLRVAADGIHIVDGQGRLVALSDSFAAMLGEAPQALLGRHVSSWDMNQDESRIAAWLAQVQPGDRQRVEVQHRHADGHAIDVELQLSVADIGGERLVFASARDITERKRLQAEIDASSQRIRDLYDQAPCGYHSLDAEGRLVEANATLLDWLGRPAAEVIGRARLADFLDAADRERFEQAFARLRADGRIDGLELSLQPRTGPPREVSLSTSAVRDADGRFLRSRSVALDISAQVRAWREAQRLMHEQAAMLDNDLVPMIKLCEDRLLWKNRALDRLFGYAPGELDGQPLRRLHLDDAGDERIRRVAAQLRGGQWWTSRR